MFKHAINYLSIPFASVLLSFVSIPVLTNLMEPGEYGTLYTFLAYVAIANIVLTLNLHSSVGRYWYEKEKGLGELITTSIVLSGVMISFFLVLAIIYSKELTSVMNMELTYIYLIFPFSIIAILSSIFNQINVAQRQSKLIAKVSIFKNYAAFVVGASSLVLLPYEKPLIMIIANIIISGFMTIFFIKNIWEYMILKINMKSLKYIFSYSVPLIPYALSGVFLAQIDRTMLNSLVGPEAVGLYSFSYTIANLFMVGMGSLLTAWTPSFFEEMNNNNYEKLAYESEILIKIAFFISVGVVFFGDDIARLLANEKFHEGLVVLPVLVIGFLFQFSFQLYGRSMGYDKKTVWISGLIVFISVLNLYLNSLFIPVYGFYGAAVTTMISYFILGVCGIVVYRLVLKRQDYMFKIFIKFLFPFLFLLLTDIFVMMNLYVEVLLLLLWTVILFRIEMFKVYLKYLK